MPAKKWGKKDAKRRKHHKTQKKKQKRCPAHIVRAHRSGRTADTASARTAGALVRMAGRVFQMVLRGTGSVLRGDAVLSVQLQFAGLFECPFAIRMLENSCTLYFYTRIRSKIVI